jgi:uncharacterized protein (TIGR02001 family)
MFKLKTIAAACGIALTASALPVMAQDAEPAAEPEEVPSVSANLGLVSDYRFRGISQTDRDPAIQGGFDYTYNPASIYVGTWLSNIDKDGFVGSPFEWDIYGGWRPKFGDFTLDLGAVYYMYPQGDDHYYGFYVDADSQNTVEFKLGGTYDFGVAAASVTGYYSDDWFLTDEPAWRIEGGVSIPLPADFALSAKFGYNSFDVPYPSGADHYQDWSIGLTYAVGGATIGLSYVDTSGLDEKDDCPAPFQCNATVVGSVLLTF